ncbi:unnamed protein product [Paramecium primaurelia]|uniref:Uncharacterized protein n=1 Tax=Paramecium primaurelia TaxID=5886 RepID=A0A8S1JPT6_PARPR|nr:unnamed protein product [Paramecium primaurelia]
MGNQICWCYNDQEETQQVQPYQNINILEQQNDNDLSLQQNQKYVDQSQTQNQQNRQYSTCDFCISYLKTLNIKLKKINQNDKSHPIHQENINESHKSNEVLALLHNDPISTIVTTWFQLSVAIPKIVQNNSKYDGILIQEQYHKQKLNCDDLQTLICLKWCVVDFFLLRQQQIHPQNKIIKECFQMFQRIVHYCIFFKELFLENKSLANNKQNIQLYIQFYELYQKLMNGYSNFYEQLIDNMQLMYQIQFDYKNENNQYPHFKLIGYMMRFWCQIMLSDQIQKILEESFKNLDQQNDQTLFYQYVNYALDVNINEDNVHWIGHRINFKYEKKLLIDKHWLKEGEQLFSSNQNCNDSMDLMLINQKMLYPLWFYEVEIELKAIQNKIKRILNEFKQESKQESLKTSFFTQSQDIELEEQLQLESENKSDQNENSYQKDLHQTQTDNLKELLTTNVILETCDSLDSTDTLDSIRQRLSTDSKISTGVGIIGNKYKQGVNIQKLTQLISDLIRNKKKQKQREFLLLQRAKKYKLKPDRKIEWLNFFEKTQFNKIPDSQKLREYIKLILNKLMENDYYKNQKEQFL